MLQQTANFKPLKLHTAFLLEYTIMQSLAGCSSVPKRCWGNTLQVNVLWDKELISSHLSFF